MNTKKPANTNSEGTSYGSLFYFETLLNLVILLIQIVFFLLAPLRAILLFFPFFLVEQFLFTKAQNILLFKKSVKLGPLFLIVSLVTLFGNSEGKLLFDFSFLKIYSNGVMDAVFMLLKLYALFFVSSYYFIRLSPRHAMHGATWLFVPLQIVGIKRADAAKIFWYAYLIFPEVLTLVRAAIREGLAAAEKRLLKIAHSSFSDTSSSKEGTSNFAVRMILFFLGQVISFLLICFIFKEWIFHASSI